MTDALCHSVTASVAAPAARAFAYLADPIALGRWSLGCMDTAPTRTPGVFCGRSQFDGSEGFFSIDGDAARLCIDWSVGPSDRLVHRISARILPGPALGYGPQTCLVTLIAWRPADMGAARWTRLVAAHEAEIWLIKAQIEQLAG